MSDNMTSENYVENVLRTDCNYNVELYERILTQARMLHAVMGMVTEVAELVDMLKKNIFYNKPYDAVNAKEEVGDITWYIGLAIDEMKTTMNDVLTLNINKLRLRYPAKFTEDCAINRDVAAERVLLEDGTNIQSIVNKTKPLPLESLFTQYDETLQREYIVVDGVRYIAELDFLNIPEQPAIRGESPLVSAFKLCERQHVSERGNDWSCFADEVFTHIEEYTIPQYGDRPNDEMTNWSIEECLKDVSKRISRYGRQAREGQQLLDFKKMAHVIQIAALKYQEEQNATR